jgi:16S rRNA (cytosine1402-N4)-methyltransferase
MTSPHIPVLLNESLDLLNVKEGKIYIDCTLGAAGHSKEILKRGGKLIGIDRDPVALNLAKKNLSGDFTLFQGSFSLFPEFLKKLNISKVDGIIADLGLSSMQLDDSERGFAYSKDGPLDMRMDKNSTLTAWDIVNTFSEKDIADILWKYGEERMSRKIAKRIVFSRPINTTSELVKVIESSIPPKLRYSRKRHSALKTFQALRIYVNNELQELEILLKNTPKYLCKNGRIVIISFHSLEDRIVKHTFRKYAQDGIFKILTKKPLVPSDKEVYNNKRSHSAKLRCAEKII